MQIEVELRRIGLAYADGLVMHTALSGPVPHLDELRLVVTVGGTVAALGSTRVNIEYLTGINPEDLVAECRAMAVSLDWSAPIAALTAACQASLTAPARMLFAIAQMDASARIAGQPLSAYLGGPVVSSVASNQSLFRAHHDVVVSRAARYVARGFRDLKLRIGFDNFANDLALLRRLRLLDPDVMLSVDVNGAWNEKTASEHLLALASLGLRYVEQPVSDWDGAARLASTGTVPVMLDESLCDMAAVARLASTRAVPLAHLKLAKLGGLDRLMRAGEMLRSVGIGVMVGQMNEGVVSTLAAAHAAAALGAPFCELYGADGLEQDPAGSLCYADGAIHLPPGPGLGLAYHDNAGMLIWETRS